MRASLLLLAFAAVACSDSTARLREHTYPPSFEYIEPARLQSAMWRLASEMQLLDRALRHPDGDSAAQQSQVAEILSRMEEATDGIATPGRVTQHPLLNRNLPRFREQLRLAVEDVERRPPNYFSATTLAGSCWACHGHSES